MSMRLATIASLATGASAFVAPQTGSLRATQQQYQQAQTQPASASVERSVAAVAVVAAGFAAAASSKSRSQRTCRRVAGVSLPYPDKWDPLNLGSSEEKLKRYTAVEIKHGRIAMIATIGYVVPEFFRYPGCETFEHGLGAFSSIPVEGWVQLVALVGAHEVLLKPRTGGMDNSDFGFGTELLVDQWPQEIERRQTVERNNGRLAMIAIMGMLVQNGIFGKTPVNLLSTDGWWGPSVQWLVQDIPVCDFSVCATVVPPRMSASTPYLRYPKQLEGWVGGEKGFDPLGFSNTIDIYLLREAELKHGRVAMLATVGWIATDSGIRFGGDVFQKVSTVDAHNKFVENGYMLQMLGFIFTLEIYGTFLLTQGISGWMQRHAGDYFAGRSFLPKEPEAESSMRLKELENGRLAMFAISGIATQAVLTGKTFPFV